MSNTNEVLFQAAVDSTQSVRDTREPKQGRVRALVGDGQGNITGPSGVPWIICRLYGDVSRRVEAYNGTPLNPSENMSVTLLMRYTDGRVTHYEVERLSNDVAYPGYVPGPNGGVAAHAPSHEFRAGGGWDAVNIYERAITSLRVNAQGVPDLTLKVAPGFYGIDGKLYYYPGGNSVPFTPPLAGARYDVLTLDTTGTLNIETGAMTLPPLVFTLVPSRMPLAAVVMSAGQTVITEAEIFDIRPFLSWGSGGGTTTDVLADSNGDNILDSNSDVILT